MAIQWVKRKFNPFFIVFIIFYLAIPFTIFYKYLPFKNKTLKIMLSTIITFSYLYFYNTLQNLSHTACNYGLIEAGFSESFIKRFGIACNFYCATFPIAIFTVYIFVMRFIKTKSSKIILLLFVTILCLYLLLKIFYAFNLFNYIPVITG